MIFIRDVTNSDNSVILDTEIKCYENPWTEVELLACKSKNIYLRVACVGGILRHSAQAGHAAFQIAGNTVKILRLCVRLNWRRQRVGSALIDHINEFAKRINKKRLQTVIRESEDARQLVACNFLKVQGFRANGILHPEGTEEEFYIFQRRVK